MRKLQRDLVLTGELVNGAQITQASKISGRTYLKGKEVVGTLH